MTQNCSVLTYKEKLATQNLKLQIEFQAPEDCMHGCFDLLGKEKPMQLQYCNAHMFLV